MVTITDERPAGGWLRLWDWLVPDGSEEAHAFTAGDRIPFRSICERARWTAKARRATTGPVCQVCRAMVRGAVDSATSELVQLDHTRPTPADPSTLWHEYLDR